MTTDLAAGAQRYLEQAIASGEIAPGATITGYLLAERLHISVEEARRVLLAAYRKGLVDRATTGDDSFCVLGLPPSRFSSVFTHTAQSGLKPRSLVRDVEIQAASAVVAQKLRVEVGSPVYRYVRTRFVEELALANQVNYMPYEVCPGLEEDDVTRFSFQKLLETKYHTIFAGMEEGFSLIPATGEDREILGLPEGSSILLIERVALGATGQPVVWANIRIRPDRYEYVAALWPEAARLLEP